MKTANIRQSLAAALLVGFTSVSLAEDQKAEEPRLDQEASPRCLSITRIKDVDILDNQTLVFKMQGNRMYLNELPNKCPGLGPHETIMYRTSINQLCDLDVITVLNSMGRSFMPGASCGLGKFSLISDMQLKSLKDAKDH